MLLKDLIEQYADYEVKDGIMDFLERPKPKSIWDLKDGDTYFYLYDNGIVCSDQWDNKYTDNKRRDIGNIFLTREEAVFEKCKIEVYKQVKRFAHEFSIDEWKDKHIYKYYPYFDCGEGVIRKYHDVFVRRNSLYFKSCENIQKAIEAVGEEDFIKYYLGVRE